MKSTIWKTLLDRRNAFIVVLLLVLVTLYKSSPQFRSALGRSNTFSLTQRESSCVEQSQKSSESAWKAPASEFEARRGQEIFRQLLALPQMSEEMERKLRQKFCPYGSVPKRFLKLYFNHPPKTAGTSIAWALSKAAGLNRRETCLGIAEYDNLQAEFNCADDVLPCHNHRWYPGVGRRISNETITVTATREPITRLIAHVKQLHNVKGKICNGTRVQDTVEGNFGLDYMHWYHLGVRPSSLAEAERQSERIARQYDFVFVTEEIEKYTDCWLRLYPELPIEMEHWNTRSAKDGECEEDIVAAKKVQSFEGVLHRALVRRGQAICNLAVSPKR